MNKMIIRINHQEVVSFLLTLLTAVSYTHLDVYKRQARPTLDESWVCFSLQSEDDPNDVILLAYQSATHVMIVAEQQK